MQIGSWELYEDERGQLSFKKNGQYVASIILTDDNKIGFYAANESNIKGSAAAFIENASSGGYGLAINHFGDNAGQPLATAGIGIDVKNRGVGERIRKQPGGKPGGYLMFLQDDGGQAEDMLWIYDKSGLSVKRVQRFTKHNLFHWDTTINSDGKMVYWFNGSPAYVFRPNRRTKVF